VGWASANPIFDTMVLKTRELGLGEKTRTEILATLVEELQGHDWDTEDESLAEFLDDPAVVEAFRRHGIEVQDWMREEPGGEDLDDDFDDRNGDEDEE
jgi:hypothetical protein